MPRRMDSWEDEVASEMYDKGLLSERNSLDGYTEEVFIEKAIEKGFYECGNDELLKTIYSRKDYYRSSFEYADDYDRKEAEEDELWRLKQEKEDREYEQMLEEIEEFEEEERQERLELQREEERRRIAEKTIYESEFVLEEIEKLLEAKEYSSVLKEADDLDWGNLISTESDVYEDCKKSVEICFNELCANVFNLLREGDFDALKNISAEYNSICCSNSWYINMPRARVSSWKNFIKLRLFLPKFLVMVQSDEKLANSLSNLSNEEIDALITSRIEDMVLEQIAGDKYESVQKYIDYLPSRKNIYDTAYRRKGDELFNKRQYTKSYAWYRKLSESASKKIPDDWKYTIVVSLVKNRKPDLAIECFNSFCHGHRKEILDLCQKAKEKPREVAMGSFCAIHFACLIPEVIYLYINGPFTNSSIKDLIILIIARLVILFIGGAVAVTIDERRNGKNNEKYYKRLADKIETYRNMN